MSLHWDAEPICHPPHHYPAEIVWILKIAAEFYISVLSFSLLQIMDQATSIGAPVIGLNDSGGARIQVVFMAALLFLIPSICLSFSD